MKAFGFEVVYKEFCQSGPYFEIKPTQPMKINLELCKDKLRAGRTSVANKYFICIRIDKQEVILYSNGKIVVRGSARKDIAQKIAKLIYDSIQR
ncbi:MAG: hypothetical protein QXW70_03310 [Candidatus Anstonellales archaeon]